MHHNRLLYVTRSKRCFVINIPQSNIKFEPENLCMVILHYQYYQIIIFKQLAKVNKINIIFMLYNFFVWLWLKIFFNLLLNGITDNGIKFIPIEYSQITLLHQWMFSSFAYLYLLVIEIVFSLSKNDSIKQCLLYF